MPQQKKESHGTLLEQNRRLKDSLLKARSEKADAEEARDQALEQIGKLRGALEKAEAELVQARAGVDAFKTELMDKTVELERMKGYLDRLGEERYDSAHPPKRVTTEESVPNADDILRGPAWNDRNRGTSQENLFYETRRPDRQKPWWLR